MSNENEKCDDRDWKTPRPSCTCGAGDDAPWSAHWSKRFGNRAEVRVEGVCVRVMPGLVLSQDGQDCALYTWHKGCHGRTPVDKANGVRVRSCPHQGCKTKIAVCDNHGGDAEAIRRVLRHLQDHIAPGGSA